MFVPRTASEIRDSWLAKLVARTKITDTSEGSDAYGAGMATGEVVAENDYRLLQYRNSFNILNPDISLADFDERVKDLPPGFVPRLGPVAASGSVFTVVRKGVAQQQTMPSGTLFGRNDGSAAVYRTVVDVVFGVGVAQVSGIYASCVTPGTIGNCGAGIITTTLNAPSWVISVTNVAKLANGAEEESLQDAQHRVHLFLSALGGSQRAAMEYLALSFVSSTNVKAKFAKGFVEKPGRGILVVDDGSGFEGLVKKGTATLTGTVPPGGQTMIAHEAPATESLGAIIVTRKATGIAEVLSESAGQMSSVYEAGYVYVPAGTGWSLLEGDVWQLGFFDTFVGYIAELQSKVSGSINDFFSTWGWAAFGCQISVRPPTKQLVQLDVHVVPVSGVDLDDVEAQVVNTTTEFIGNLGPGEPLYMAQLIAAIMVSPDVLNVRIYEPGTAVGKGDVYPSAVTVLRADASNVNFVPEV